MAGEKSNGCATNIPYSKSGDRSQDEVFILLLLNLAPLSMLTFISLV
jgi:hypothetical protein